jgi:hypothetical protein
MQVIEQRVSRGIVTWPRTYSSGITFKHPLQGKGNETILGPLSEKNTGRESEMGLLVDHLE